MQKLPEVVGICDSKCWAEAERCSQDCWEIGPIKQENIPNTGRAWAAGLDNFLN